MGGWVGPGVIWVGGWVRGPKGPENFFIRFGSGGKFFGAWVVKMTTPPGGGGSGWVGTQAGGPGGPPGVGKKQPEPRGQPAGVG